MKKSMLEDEGVDFLGMRLIIVLIAAALLVSLGAAIVNDRIENASREKARQECARIAFMAETEYATGCPGDSGVPILVYLPGNIRQAAFGTEYPRAYRIEFLDGTVEAYTAECRFSPAVLYKGEHRLEIYTVSINGSYAVGLREGS
jgi:hypothetical protein